MVVKLLLFRSLLCITRIVIVFCIIIIVASVLYSVIYTDKLKPKTDNIIK
jgi:hypothetical protein